MKLPEIKKLMISSLEEGTQSHDAFRKLEEEGVSYDFSKGFTGKVLDSIFTADVRMAKQIEFSRYMSIAFSRVALTGVAAIVLLLISIFVMQGDLSLNTLLGVSDTQTESIVCLLTGN